MLRHIAWFNEALIEPLPEGGLTSPDPMVCTRYLAPARKMEELGVECSVFGNLHDADPAQVTQHLQKLDTDIVVIGQISEPQRYKLATAAKHIGCYVVADFGHATDMSLDLVKLSDMADHVVTASSEAAVPILQETGSVPTVIPDCDGQTVTAEAAAHLWLNCFKKLKLKPPASANTNLPA